MYSVSEIAKLCKVSTVAVYKKIKKLENIDRFVVKDNNKIMILDEGYQLIKNSLQVNKPGSDDEVAVSIEANKKNEENKESLNNLIEFFKEQINVKDAQIAEKDSQIKSLHELIEKSNKLTENTQILFKEEQRRNNIKLIDEKSLEEHQKKIDQKLDDIREKMDSRAVNKTKKKNFWWNKKGSE